MMWFKHYYCSGEYCLFTLYRTSSKGEHKMVVTSSNEAYGVVSIKEEHEYDVIGLQQTPAQHTSAAELCH